MIVGATMHSRWCYAYSKGIDEFLGLAYFPAIQPCPVVLVRLFNTVGPRQIGAYGMVLPRFVTAALANSSLQVYGDGEQTRCFCHVSDVVDALVRLMETPAAAGRSSTSVPTRKFRSTIWPNASSPWPAPVAGSSTFRTKRPTGCPWMIYRGASRDSTESRAAYWF